MSVTTVTGIHCRISGFIPRNIDMYRPSLSHISYSRAAISPEPRYQWQWNQSIRNAHPSCRMQRFAEQLSRINMPILRQSCIRLIACNVFRFDEITEWELKQRWAIKCAVCKSRILFFNFSVLLEKGKGEY